MKTEAEIRMKGMQALISALGLVEAERFLVAVSRDKFDYTEWRRTGRRKARDRAAGIAGQDQPSKSSPRLDR